MNRSVLQKVLEGVKDRLGIPARVETLPPEQVPSAPKAAMPQNGVNYTLEELHILFEQNSKQLLDQIHEVKSLFGGQIFGPDTFDWEAHAQRMKSLSGRRCYACKGIEFWALPSWKKDDQRCVRCHPPAEPDKAIWLQGEIKSDGSK